MQPLSQDADDFNPEINTTPLVDVMLVLLVIFMITIPAIQHSVRVNVPQAAATPLDSKPQHVDLSIDAAGDVFWNREALALADLEARMREAAGRQPQPELHLRAERSTRYEKVAQVMAAAQRSGLSKVGFVTEPESR